MRQVARFCLENLTQNDFKQFYTRSALLKLRSRCMLVVNRDFDRRNAFELKSLIHYLKSKKKHIYLDVRDSEHHEIVLELLQYVEAVKIKYEYLRDSK